MWSRRGPTTSASRRHRGRPGQRGDRSRRRILTFLSSLMLLSMVGLYLMMGQVVLLSPMGRDGDAVPQRTVVDILRKEQAARRQRLERLRQEAEAKEEVAVGGAKNHAEKAELPQRKNRKVAEEPKSDGTDYSPPHDPDDTVPDDDDGESGDSVLDDALDDEVVQDDADVENDDDGLPERQDNAQADNHNDDVALQQKLIDPRSDHDHITRAKRIEIENIRRRMDEDVEREPRLPVAKLQHTNDHDAKNRHKLPFNDPLDDHRRRRREILTRLDERRERGSIRDRIDPPQVGETAGKEEKGTVQPRKLPKLQPMAAIRNAPIEGDPLRAEQWPFESKGRISVRPTVPYLGTLIDAGRHYFPIAWLKRVVDRLADMNYNLIHLRLTDDQTFNVLLKSRPQLAYPTALWNPDRKVYTPEELRDLTAYAKAKGIAIMPEINVPGHAGAWAGIPHMIVHCPGFICEKGYGLPLNVTHHELKPILTDVIKEVIDIFDSPPFLHLGGDEVNMADPCFREVQHEVFDYPAFELVLKDIINATGYPEDQIVRWEMTGQKSLVRAGGIEQFWESHPGVRHEASGKFFVSTWLYFDTNSDQDAYEVYTKTVHSFHLKGGKMPTAIIAGTFELNAEFWYDRNVLGRLLAVAIGASNPELPNNKTEAQKTITKKWNELCTHLGFGEIICDTDGQPVISSRIYHEKWRGGWEIWKADLCERLTTSVPFRSFKVVGDKIQRLRQVVGGGNEFFWRNFPLQIDIRHPDDRLLSVLPPSLASLEKHSVPHVGVILDAVSAMPKINRIHSIIQDHVVKLGLNTVQLRLINNNGWVYMSDVHPHVAHSLIAGDDNPLYSLGDLRKLVVDAGRMGVQIIPEITTTSDAGGWINTQLLVDCPDHFCSGQGTPININDERYLPVLFSVIAELRKTFNSRLIHLGTDEREASAPCFRAADMRPSFSAFERKLETLMALAEITPEDIIRNDNLEGIRYPDRTGDITQYPAGVTQMRSGEKAFLTVDIFDGDGYKIFQNTQKATSVNPLGVLAELRKLSESKWKKWHVPKRLLAFAMGVSELGNSWSIYDAASFGKHFLNLCQQLELDEDCSPPAEFTSSIRIITDSQEFIRKNCDVRTSLGEKKIAVPVKPYFDVSANGQVIAPQ